MHNERTAFLTKTLEYSWRTVEFLVYRLNSKIWEGMPKAKASVCFFTDDELRKRGEQRGLETPVVLAVTDVKSQWE